MMDLVLTFIEKFYNLARSVKKKKKKKKKNKTPPHKTQQ